MEQFTEEHEKELLSKEWIIKIDAGKKTPFLAKYGSSSSSLSCWLLITDTKKVWVEVLNSNQIARRWREQNPKTNLLSRRAEEEDAWRDQVLDVLSKAHSIGGWADLSFESIDSNYSDFAFELDCEIFKWKWETCFLGYQQSSEIISKHLIFPLIGTNHMAFTSSEVSAEQTDTDIEKAVDKVGRVARRTLDTHVKNALSKPRVATTIRRMTAMFNFISDLPPVISEAEMPDLRVPAIEQEESTQSQEPSQKALDLQSRPLPKSDPPKPIHAEGTKILIEKENQDSATESDDDEPMNANNQKSNLVEPVRPSQDRNVANPKKSRTPQPLPSKNTATSDSESSPQRPVKKAKQSTPDSDSEDSEQERKRRIAELKSGSSSGTGTKRGGTRQPIKRGGKRF